MATYQEVIQAVIEKETGVVGVNAAVSEAERVDGLTVDEEGTVLSVEGEGKTVLATLVQRYVDLYGEVAATLIARRLESMDLSGIELPEILAERMG